MGISAGSYPSCPLFIKDEEHHRREITQWMVRVSPLIVDVNALSTLSVSGATVVAGLSVKSSLSVSGSALISGILSCPNLASATTDASAASLGVPIGGFYRNANVVQVRVT